MPLRQQDDSEFWTGYRACLDDLERRLHHGADATDVAAWAEKVRAKFNLPERDDSGRAELPDHVHDSLDADSRAALVKTGVPETAVDELLALARRRGREASEAG